MSESHDAIAKSIIDDALDMQGAARNEFLERRCTGDAALRSRVDSLLSAMEVDDAFLRTPTVDLTAPQNGSPSADAPGGWIGPYRLLELVGEGGFGTVFLAEQASPVRRQVAIKLIRPGMDSRQILARFSAERQALALMDHPNIARVFDAGASESGRPYLAMEFVRGEPLTDYCDRRRLSVAERVRLFRDICFAVEHAHQKGLIHRDIKPSNVLVTTTNDLPIPKVIDFGVAKAAMPNLAGGTRLTEVHQLVGTPAYMSPEQADFRGVDVDTRSDVYSLGVLLYELLTGAPPFDAGLLRNATLAELQRLIQVEVPLLPSRRVATRGSSASVRLKTPRNPSTVTEPDWIASVAQRRQVTPQLLPRAIRGDLDWIVMKCLEKERSRRYQTVAALSDDLTRYLDHQPVLATPPSRRYRFRKLVRRHRMAVTAGMLIIVALLGGLAAALYGLGIARDERDAARRARDGESRQRLSAERVAEFMENMLAGASPEVAAGLDTTLLRSFLDSAVERIDRGEIRDAPEAEANLRITISNTYRTIGDTSRAAQLLAPLDTGLRETVRGNELLWERYLDSMSVLRSVQSRFGESTVLLWELAALRRRIFGEHDRRVAIALTAISVNDMSQGRYQDSLDVLEDALEIAEATGDDATLANVLSNRAEPLSALGRPAEAVAAAERALDHSRKAYSGDHPFLADALNNLAAALRSIPAQSARVLALLRESVEMKRRLFPSGHPHLGIGLFNLATALDSCGELEEAERAYRDAIESLRRYSPLNDADLVATLLNLCRLEGRRGRHDQREAYAREALAICERLYPQGHETTSFAFLNIGSSLRDRGRNECVEYFERAVEVQRKCFDPTDPRLASSLAAVGSAMIDARQLSDAFPVLQEALAIRRTLRADDPGAFAASLSELALAMIESGSLESARDAEALARESLEIRERILPSGDWRLLYSTDVLASALVAIADLDQNAPVADRLVKFREAEPLIEANFNRLDQVVERLPPARRSRMLEHTAERIVRMYALWETLDPSADLHIRANKWRAKARALVDRQ